MTPAEVNRFNKLYLCYLKLLKLQGKSRKTIDAYSRAVRQVSKHFDCCPDQLPPEQLEVYFVFERKLRSQQEPGGISAWD